MTRAPALLLLALLTLAACDAQVESVVETDPCAVLPGGRCTNGIPMCVGICVYPAAGPGRCEIPATSALVCGGDGSCDDGDPCTIDQGLPGGCLHDPLPVESGCR